MSRKFIITFASINHRQRILLNCYIIKLKYKIYRFISSFSKGNPTFPFKQPFSFTSVRASWYFAFCSSPCSASLALGIVILQVRIISFYFAMVYHAIFIQQSCASLPFLHHFLLFHPLLILEDYLYTCSYYYTETLRPQETKNGMERGPFLD